MNLLPSLPLYPLLSFCILIVFAKKLTWQQVAWISVGSMFLTAFSSGFMVLQLMSVEASVITSQLWQWFTLTTGNQSAEINVTFYLDGLSAVMISVVTGVGLLIHMFAAIYMRTDKNFSRFMAYMNLFIVAMLVLVLADNLVLLYLGWEGVGLCSFLLIGFWYQEKENVLAARKAFIVTRIGDTSMAIGLFWLFFSLGELNISQVNQAAQVNWLSLGSSHADAYWIALLLLGGAVGKSAQLPLQTWLPDAMAGPTPVSALIHAATMVTAGVYLIARMQGVFLMAPEVMNYVAIIGTVTFLLAGIAALTQSDIKRVLAYSTMSQIGYMMLALGAGAWSAGVFHLMTHAFFKALLFLTAGAVILALHHQQNIFKMGGLIKKLPFESSLFVIGLVCLMALPGSSGFFSKEAIIAELWSSPTAGPVLWWGAILGALLTSIYSCRLFFLAFLGNSRFPKDVDVQEYRETHWLLKFSLIILAVLSLLGGFFAFDLSTAFNSVNLSLNNTEEPGWLHSVAIATPFLGIVFSWFYFAKYRKNNGKFVKPTSSSIYRFCQHGLGFDLLYKVILINPYQFLAKLNRRDVINQILMLTAGYVKLCRDVLSNSQNGSIRWFAAAFGLSLFIFIGGIII